MTTEDPLSASDLPRRPPTDVARKLRQEAGFGCAKCGSPILDYHHIIPWSEVRHHEPEHMVALCPTHHREIGKLSRSRAYELKQNPHNQRTGWFRGILGTDKAQTDFVLGGMVFRNTLRILEYCKVPIISYKFVEGQHTVSAYIPKDNFWPDLEIIDNDVAAQVGEYWDITFQTNFLEFRKRKGSIFFSIDLRGERAEVKGKFLIGGRNFEFGTSESAIGGNTFRNVSFENVGTGFSIGPPGRRLLRPNYAQLRPSMIFIEDNRERTVGQ